MSNIGPPLPDPIGALGRVNDTRNIDAQAHDHDLFSETSDALGAWATALDANPITPMMLGSFGGLAIPPRTLDWWKQAPTGIVHVACCGDSTTVQPGFDVASGGLGNWTERLSRSLGIPVVGAGFKGMWRGLPFDVNGGWVAGRIVYDPHSTAGSKIITSATAVFTAADVGSTIKLYDAAGNFILNSTIQFFDSATQVRAVATASGNTTSGRMIIGPATPWTIANGLEAWNCAPFGFAVHATGGSCTQYTYELGPGQTCAAFDLFWFDASGSGNFRYRVDNGAWVPMGQTRVGDNQLHSFRVVANAAKTISIQAWTGTAAAHAYLGGVSLYAVNPANVTRGLVVHNIAKAGETLHHFVGNFGTPNPTPMAILSGDPGSINPHLVTMMFTNDSTVIADVPTWSADLADFIAAPAAVVPHAADVLLMNIWERNGGTNYKALQAQYRDATKAFAAANARAALDWYDALAAIGFAGFDACNTLNGTVTQPNGFMVDDTHQAPLLLEFQAAQLRRALLLG